MRCIFVLLGFALLDFFFKISVLAVVELRRIGLDSVGDCEAKQTGSSGVVFA